MKTLTTLAFCLFTALVQADFISAQKDYHSNKYEKAFNEFQILAKLGNNKAQFNLAVMLAKGQGVEIDLVEAYAWSKVSELDQTIKKLSGAIKKELSEHQMIQAQNLYEEYFEKYSFNNSKVVLGPVIEDDTVNKNILDHQLLPDINHAPNYPKHLAIKGIQGWVDLKFQIFPDGSVRNIYVLGEMPPNSFAEVAMKSVSIYHYSFKKDGQKTTIDEPLFATQRIEFKLKSNSTDSNHLGINDKQQKFLEELIQKAENGDTKAQYNYAYLYDTYLHKKGDIGGEKINQWLFNAAIDGITGAQYRLGQNIYYGNNCKIEKQKGLDWIMKAAQIGNADAQYMAYTLLKDKTVINQTDSSPFYWLTQAANNGLT